MSSAVEPAGTTSGTAAQLALDPCAVILVLVDKTETDVKAPPPSDPGQSGSRGRGFDAYA